MNITVAGEHVNVTFYSTVFGKTELVYSYPASFSAKPDGSGELAYVVTPPDNRLFTDEGVEVVGASLPG